MNKVKQVWYTSDSKEVSSRFATGLILELEDGTMIEQLSDSVLQPYAPQKRLSTNTSIGKDKV